jgi:hypothetical protein
MLNAINSATQCKVMLPPSATECCHVVCKVSSTPKACGAAVAVRSGRCPVRTQESKVRFADIHVVICQVKARVSRARSGERANQLFQDVLRATVCLSASVPALGRTRHPFAVSGSEEPSQKIEFVFSASPETIRREPREGELLRSVGKMQDLAVCAFLILFLSALVMLPQICALQQA